MSETIRLTRPDGIAVYVVKSQMVCWSNSAEHKGGSHIILVNGFQDVKEKPEKIWNIFEST